MTSPWLVGADATRAERLLVYGLGSVVAGTVWWVFLRTQQEWSWWQQLVAAAIALDLCAGAISNATNATKAQYRQPTGQAGVGGQASSSGRFGRLARDPLVFASVHVYPLLIAAIYPGVTWLWGAGWYVAMLVSVAITARLVPKELQRPVAMALLLCVVVTANATTGPAGWQWLPYVYFAKLLLGHAVEERSS
ncbi:MAG: hypothetical protein ACKN9D_05610 [Actinomycetales bacterium]